MIKYLTPHGNSSALVIEKAVMELLKINQKTALEVSTDGQSLIISPVGDSKRENKLRLALDGARGDDISDQLLAICLIHYPKRAANRAF